MGWRLDTRTARAHRAGDSAWLRTIHLISASPSGALPASQVVTSFVSAEGSRGVAGSASHWRGAALTRQASCGICGGDCRHLIQNQALQGLHPASCSMRCPRLCACSIAPACPVCCTPGWELGSSRGPLVQRMVQKTKGAGQACCYRRIVLSCMVGRAGKGQNPQQVVGAQRSASCPASGRCGAHCWRSFCGSSGYVQCLRRSATFSVAPSTATAHGGAFL